MSSHRKVIFPHADAPAGRCKWCGKRIIQGRRDRAWHDGRLEDPAAVLKHAERTGIMRVPGREPDCKHQSFVATSLNSQRYELKRENRWFCADCGRPPESLNLPARYLHYSGDERSNLAVDVWRWLTVDDTEWNDRAGGYVVTREAPLRDPLCGRARRRGPWPWLEIAHQLRMDRGRYLEVDHIIPLVDCDERGVDPLGRFLVGNLQALCRRHHKAKTAREAAERAARRRGAPAPASQMALL